MSIYIPETIEIDYECESCGDTGLIQVYLEGLAHHESYRISTCDLTCPVCGKSLDNDYDNFDEDEEE